MRAKTLPVNVIRANEIETSLLLVTKRTTISIATTLIFCGTDSNDRI